MACSCCSYSNNEYTWSDSGSCFCKFRKRCKCHSKDRCSFSRDIWDVQFNFDIDGPSGLTGLAGAESDGEFIYATKWAGSEIVKFDLDGTFIETFSIPGVSGLRDLAFDGTHFYGAAAATTVYKMDFTAHTLVSSFTAPTAVRAIAYDSDADAFWGNNWDTDMVLFDETGATLDVLTGMPSLYGTAYDSYSEGGPFLWFFTGTTTGGGCQLEQYDLAANALTGVSHSVSADFGDYIAGGLTLLQISLLVKLPLVVLLRELLTLLSDTNLPTTVVVVTRLLPTFLVTTSTAMTQ